MRSVIVPITAKARMFFEERGMISLPAVPFLTTLAEKGFSYGDYFPLKRGEDFLEYVLLEEE